MIFPDFDERKEAGCEVKSCDEKLFATDQSQKLTSKNYPSEYPSLLNCVVSIESENPDNLIQITFDDLDLEGTLEGSCHDYLEFFDGASTQSTRRVVMKSLKVCGREIKDPEPFRSSGSKLTVKFSSDTTVNKRGFMLSYVSVPRKTKRHVENELKMVQMADEESNIINHIEFNGKNRILKGETSKIVENYKLGKNSYKRQKRADYSLNSVTDSTNDYKDSTDNDNETDSDYGTVSGSDYTDDYVYSSYDYDFENDNFYQYDYTDFFNLYKASVLSDYSDFKRAAYFFQSIVRPNGNQGLFKLQAHPSDQNKKK